MATREFYKVIRLFETWKHKFNIEGNEKRPNYKTQMREDISIYERAMGTFC